MNSLRSLIAVPILLAGCGVIQQAATPPTGPEPEASAQAGAARPVARPRAGTPQTAESFDTTTETERTAAAAPASQGEQRLGTTVASLGDPTEAGFWLRTPLVDTPAPGRVVSTGTGQSARVELRPLAAAPGSGSQISLAAMRLIGAPLTGLPEIEVYRLPGG